MNELNITAAEIKQYEHLCPWKNIQGSLAMSIKVKKPRANSRIRKH